MPFHTINSAWVDMGLAVPPTSAIISIGYEDFNYVRGTVPFYIPYTGLEWNKTTRDRMDVASYKYERSHRLETIPASS